MSIETLQEKIRQVAPALAALMDGPMQATAVASLGKFVAEDDDAEIDAIEDRIDDTPATAEKVKEAEADAFKQIASASPEIEQARIASQDLSRRLETWIEAEKVASDDRQVTRTQRANAKDWWLNPVLALAVTAGFFGIVAYLLGNDETKGKEVGAIAQTLLGVMGTAWITIITYYFGSSVGSKEKTALLADELENKTE